MISLKPFTCFQASNTIEGLGPNQLHWFVDESIFKSKEVKEKPRGIDEASMEKDEGAEARR